MTIRCWLSRCLQLVFFCFLGGLGVTTFTLEVLAQSNIVPDNTLGAESSQVLPDFNGLPIEEITGGATRGVNLFHSFQEFNVSDGRGAYFLIPNASIQNVLARVTGNNPSEILGTLGTFGDSQPNLYLINPNGIIFGENASLDLGGSFIATTANAIKLGETGFFSATQPASNNLLAVNPSALLYNAITNQAQIVNRSTGLNVVEGKSLLLVGGNVLLDSGALVAPGGRIELGAVTEPGIVGLSVNDNILSLNFPNNLNRADVSLSNGSRLDVTSGNGGSIGVNAKNIDISGRSVIVAGIGSELGSVDSQAGDISLNATEAIKIERSQILNLVNNNATGNGGSINITTGELSVTNRAQLAAATFGEGNAGNLIIDAKERVVFDDNSAAFSYVEESGKGNSGGIRITTNELSVTNDAQLIASTFGEGNAGNLIIDAKERVLFDGTNSGAFSVVELTNKGNSGEIRVTTGELSVKNGAQIATSTFGQGNAGNVIIDAKERILLDGRNTAVLSVVEPGAIGKGGAISITTGELFVTNGAQIAASTSGQGNAGNLIIDTKGRILFDGINSGAFSAVEPNAQGNGGEIRITTDELSVTNDAQIAASTAGEGNAGNLIIDAKGRVLFDGNGGAFSNVEQSGKGQGGNISITTGEMFVTNGSQLIANTFGQGDAGNIEIKAFNFINISGTKNGFSSGLGTSTSANSTGKGGNIIVDTNIFRLSDGAILDASTFNDQQGGNITVLANQVQLFNGGQLISSTFGNGRAGKITVNAKDQVIVSGADPTFNDRLTKFPTQVLNLGANSGFFVRSENSGIAGDIEVISPKVTLDNQGRFIAESASGNGGNINLQVANLLLLRRNALISTNAGTAQQGGDGGNININAKFIVAIPEENSDITANAFTGKGGNVQIKTQGNFGIESRPRPTAKSDITASSTLGVQGVTNINTPDNDSIQNSLTELPDNLIDTNRLIANSCIARSLKQEGTFLITGSGSLPLRPGDVLASSYPTGDVQNVMNDNAVRRWQKGDPIIEAEGIYRLPNGQLLISRECR